MAQKTIETPHEEIPRVISDLTDICQIFMENSAEICGSEQKRIMVAVVSDCTEVLNLGDTDVVKGLPLIKSKANNIAKFANANTVTMCLETKDLEKVISVIKAIADKVDAICLEGISTPRCVLIEERLKKELGIPIFHNNKHGIAIAIATATVNVSRILNKELSDLTILINETESTESPIKEMLKIIGVKKLYNFFTVTNEKGSIQIDNGETEMKNADVIIKISDSKKITFELTSGFQKEGDKILNNGIIAIRNYIEPELALYGIIKGTLKCGLSKVYEEIEMAAIYALASVLSDSDFSNGRLLPQFDEKIIDVVARNIDSVARDLRLSKK